MVCLGLEPGAADESTELWRHPIQKNVYSSTDETIPCLHYINFPFFNDWVRIRTHDLIGQPTSKCAVLVRSFLFCC